MYGFIFNNPTKILFGEEHRKILSKYILNFGKKVLLVYGKESIKKSGLYDEIIDDLKSHDISIYEINNIDANPSHTKVNEGVKICKNNCIDVILAVGGGSVIDCAKAISITSKSDLDCWDIITKKEPVNSAIPVITIVTIAGTGSEMNNSCVISNKEKRIKRGFSHELLFPKISFLDPKLTFSVPAFNTACGCADILSHVLDTAFFLPGDRMELLCMIMESVCKTIIKYGPIAVREPDNYIARSNILWASSFALNGILKNGIRCPAVCHIIEHEISAFYDINHGLGMAIVLPKWMEYVLDKNNAHIFAEFGRSVFDLLISDDLKCAKETICKIKEFLYVQLNLPYSLKDLGIDDSEFEIMAENICWGDSIGGLKKLYTNDIYNILKACC